jgi:hypothetical protein
MRSASEEAGMRWNLYQQNVHDPREDRGKPGEGGGVHPVRPDTRLGLLTVGR